MAPPWDRRQRVKTGRPQKVPENLLKLYHTLVTEKGMEALKSKLPGCQIIWDKGFQLADSARRKLDTEDQWFRIAIGLGVLHYIARS